MKRHFERQATYCSAFCADLTARLLRRLPDCISPNSALGQRITNWPGDPAPEADNLPLRLAGGLHALLLSAKARDLAPIYRSGAMADAELPAVLRSVLQRHDAELSAFIANAPQTNEVRRAAGLVAAAHWLKAYTGCDLIASELGASAGLNLVFDRFHLAVGQGYWPPDSPVQLTPKWQGSLPPAAPYLLRDAQGCDLAPLDLRQKQDLLRLHAYIWADQPERRARTDAAISLNPPLAKKSSAIEFLRQRRPLVQLPFDLFNGRLAVFLKRRKEPNYRVDNNTRRRVTGTPRVATDRGRREIARRRHAVGLVA
ncbi:DUF2332 domain-containing protein [Planktomarina temperata]|nr:DUF2332 domain-containing protein [Planktomarina temperata]